MGFTQFLVEIFIGNQIAERKAYALPIFVAIAQSSDICIQAHNDSQPIKIVFHNSEGETLEYKNPAFIKFEGGN